jgi:hypothetical protein
MGRGRAVAYSEDEQLMVWSPTLPQVAATRCDATFRVFNQIIAGVD